MLYPLSYDAKLATPARTFRLSLGSIFQVRMQAVTGSWGLSKPGDQPGLPVGRVAAGRQVLIFSACTHALSVSATVIATVKDYTADTTTSSAAAIQLKKQAHPNPNPTNQNRSGSR